MGSATTYCTPSISNSKRSHTAKFYYPINQAINIFSHSKHRMAVNFRQQYFVALPVWIPDKPTRELRRICSFRKSLVQEATATKNRIKGILNHLLIKFAVAWTQEGLEGLKSLALPPVERAIMDREVAILEHQELQIEKIEVEIQNLAYAEDNIRLLMTLPSVGYNTASCDAR